MGGALTGAETGAVLGVAVEAVLGVVGELVVGVVGVVLTGVVLVPGAALPPPAKSVTQTQPAWPELLWTRAIPMRVNAAFSMLAL
jgi:hypothetical protein